MAAGVLPCANYLYIPVLPDLCMDGAKADGEQAARQPQTRPGCLQFCHGLPVCLHVLRGRLWTQTKELNVTEIFCEKKIIIFFRVSMDFNVKITGRKLLTCKVKVAPLEPNYLNAMFFRISSSRRHLGWPVTVCCASQSTTATIHWLYG